MDDLPETFTVRDAVRILQWQGSPKVLTRHLERRGFVKFMGRDPTGTGSCMQFRRPVKVAVPCACRCHTGTCGANDMDMAERSLRMVEAMGIRDADTITVLNDLVIRAGVDYAKTALNFGNLDSDVPF
jgi:hypothetical protein